MTRAPKNVTRAALVLALASSAGVLVTGPAVAAVGDLTGGTTPLPVPTVTTSPLPLPLPLDTSSPSPTPSPSSSSPTPSPSPSPSSATSPTPTTDATPTPSPSVSSAPAPAGTTSSGGGSTYIATDTATGSTTSAGTLSFAGSDTTSATSTTQSTTQSATRSSGFTDLTNAPAARTGTPTLPGVLDLSHSAGGSSSGPQAGATDQQIQAGWSDGLSPLTLPAIPGVSGASAPWTSPLPGIAPLIAGAPQAAPGARLTTRPVLTSSRTVSGGQGDPVGLTLFACVAAAVAAGLSRRRSRGRSY